MIHTAPPAGDTVAEHGFVADGVNWNAATLCPKDRFGEARPFAQQLRCLSVDVQIGLPLRRFLLDPFAMAEGGNGHIAAIAQDMNEAGTGKQLLQGRNVEAGGRGLVSQGPDGVLRSTGRCAP